MLTAPPQLSRLETEEVKSRQIEFEAPSIAQGTSSRIAGRTDNIGLHTHFLVVVGRCLKCCCVFIGKGLLPVAIVFAVLVTHSPLSVCGSLKTKEFQYSLKEIRVKS